MRHLRKRAALLAAVLVLAACSGGTDRPSANLQVFGAVRDRVAANLAEKPPQPQVTRALIDSTVNEPFMEATLEQGGQVAYMFIEARRPDEGNGAVTVWRTFDEVTLAMRNGVLIATRGLGGDLLSTEIQVPASRPGPSDSGHRVQHIRDDDDGTVPLSLACALTDLGPETIEIVELRHRTRHLRERCVGGGGTVINDYWIDSGKPLVRQSRQWAGPAIGYLKLRRLKD